jgi:amino acid transporter
MGKHIIQLAPLTLGLGILVSPDTLVRLGNFMGHTGWAGLPLLTAAMVIFLILLPGIRASGTQIGLWTYLPLTIKTCAAIFLTTGILVSSGFVFNEVFLYWFPNFGFAFLLLALVLGVQLWGIKPAVTTQFIIVFLTIFCLAGLIFSGLSKPEGGLFSLPNEMPKISALFLPLMLWVGVDLAGSVPAGNDRTAEANRQATPLGLTIVLAGLLFLLWGVVSILHVPAEKLAGSSIPHLKTARYILGDTGRYFMGAVIIFGSLSGVNALFLACKRETSRLIASGSLPGWAGKSFAVPILLSTAVGLAMALGLAGSEKLEIWIQAVFILWLLSYSGLFTGKTINSDSRAIKASKMIIYIGVGFLLLSGDTWQIKTIYFLTILGISLTPGGIQLVKKRLKS